MIGQETYHPWAIVGATLVANIFLAVGILLTLISIKNKEEKNYQYHVSVWGYAIFLILTLISIFSEIEFFK
jgi:succinate dehydrogenase hydrophobic anchor subunit